MTITDELRAEVKDFCGINDNDSNTLIDGLINAADEYLQGAIGIYPQCERSKLLIKILVNDFFTNRETESKVTSSTRKLVDSMILQLQMETKIASEVVV